MDPADNPAANATKQDIITIWSEAATLFKDNGVRRDFAPGAAVRSMPGLREQRKNHQFCDIVFRAPDGSETWAHRYVMAARYSGCHALLALAKEGMSPEQKWLPPMRIVMEDLGSDMIKLLVLFAYRTPLHELVGPDNVGQVLELAEKLELCRLRNHCLNVLKHNLEPESCIGNYHLASSRGYDFLASEAFRYVVRNFDRVWKKSSQFEALTPEDVRAILEDNRLHAPNEVEDAFNALIKWIHADLATRKGYLAKFLPLLRLGRCSFTDFEKVITSPEVQADGDCLKVLDVIQKSITGKSLDVGEVAGINLSHKMWMTPRVPKHIIFVFGGWTVGAVNNMHTYNCRAVKWRDMGNMYTSPRCYHGVAVINQCIYVVGGFNGREIYHSVVCFDVTLNRWTSKANMEFPRCYVSVAVLKGHIYAMGGYDGRQRFKTVERYDVNANHWTQLADMNDIRSDAGAAVAHGRVYIAGGFTGWTVLESVEFYDPSTNVWTRVQSMPWRRSGHKLVAHKGIIYVIGGYNGTSRVSTLAEFDVKRGRFSELPSMPQAKSVFAAAVLEGCIYTIGGFDGTTTVTSVERYDIAAGKWYTAPPISTKCSAHAACVVKNVANPATWT